MPSPHLETPRGTAETLNRQRKPVTGRRLRQTAGVSHILSVPDKAGKAKSCSGPDSPSCCTQLANDPLHTIHLANNPLMPHTPSKWSPHATYTTAPLIFKERSYFQLLPLFSFYCTFSVIFTILYFKHTTFVRRFCSYLYSLHSFI